MAVLGTTVNDLYLDLDLKKLIGCHVRVQRVLIDLQMAINFFFQMTKKSE